jgi:DNA/RNA endonuclease G (NUC1)
MNQKELFRLLPFIGLMLSQLLCLGQDDRFLPDVEGHRIDRESYVMIWDSALRFPKVIAYEVTREELNSLDCGGARYHADPNLNEYSATDYEGAADRGFEKGHMMPVAQGTWNEASCLHTSFYSNISPQSKKLNRGAWYDSDLLVDSLVALHDRVYVHTGLLPITVEFLPSGMPVPMGYWKVVIYQTNGKWFKECYLFSQYPNIDKEAFDLIHSKLGFVNGRYAYTTKEKALEVAEKYRCRGYDTYQFEGATWYLACENGDPSKFEKLDWLSCDTQLLEVILGFELYDDKEQIENKIRFVKKEEMMVDFYSRMLNEYGEEFFLQRITNVETELGQETMINEIRRASMGCGPLADKLNSNVNAVLTRLVPKALELYRMK